VQYFKEKAESLMDYVFNKNALQSEEHSAA
jgi:hypothetical protein